jgi:hypothetical protein
MARSDARSIASLAWVPRARTRARLPDSKTLISLLAANGDPQGTWPVVPAFRCDVSASPESPFQSEQGPFKVNVWSRAMAALRLVDRPRTTWREPC